MSAYCPHYCLWYDQLPTPCSCSEHNLSSEPAALLFNFASAIIHQAYELASSFASNSTIALLAMILCRFYVARLLFAVVFLIKRDIETFFQCLWDAYADFYIESVIDAIDEFLGTWPFDKICRMIENVFLICRMIENVFEQANNAYVGLRLAIKKFFGCCSRLRKLPSEFLDRAGLLGGLTYDELKMLVQLIRRYVRDRERASLLIPQISLTSLQEVETQLRPN